LPRPGHKEKLVFFFLCILLAIPHAAEQVVFFDELVIQGSANM
jgi:hypothetical protein